MLLMIFLWLWKTDSASYLLPAIAEAGGQEAQGYLRTCNHCLHDTDPNLLTSVACCKFLLPLSSPLGSQKWEAARDPDLFSLSGVGYYYPFICGRLL